MVAEQGESYERRRLPAGTVAYRRYHGTIPSIESVTPSVRSWVVTMGFTPQGPTTVEINGTPSADLSEEYEIEVQLPVGEDATADPSDTVQVKPFVATEAVVLTLRGPYELTGIAEPLARMRAWSAAQRLQPLDVVRWVEITDPTKVSPEEQVTEVQFLLP